VGIALLWNQRQAGTVVNIPGTACQITLHASSILPSAAGVLEACASGGWAWPAPMGNSTSRKENDEELFFAAAHGDAARLAEYIELDANPNHVSTDKEFDSATPTIVAVQDNSIECVRLLLACSDIERNRADKWGWTPLHHAAWLGFPDCVEALLDARADPGCRCTAGSTPLHYAAASDKSEPLRLLLHHDSRLLGARDRAGLTALQLAERAGASECVSALLEAQAESVEEQTKEVGVASETDQLLV
jgi:ankyrin repeat protein